jgi:hypothetical protein
MMLMMFRFYMHLRFCKSLINSPICEFWCLHCTTVTMLTSLKHWVRTNTSLLPSSIYLSMYNHWPVQQLKQPKCWSAIDFWLHTLASIAKNWEFWRTHKCWNHITVLIYRTWHKSLVSQPSSLTGLLLSDNDAPLTTDSLTHLHTTNREISRFIASGRLHCKIDKVGGIIETNRADSKNAQYQSAIKQGDLLLNRVQKLSRVINL